MLELENMKENPVCIYSLLSSYWLEYLKIEELIIIQVAINLILLKV